MDYQSIKDALPRPAKDFEACYAFSVHKCGSTMMNNMIGAVCQVERLPAAALPAYFFNEGIAPDIWSRDPKMLPLFRKNLIYYDFRFLPPIFKGPNFAKAASRFVLLVRDPRDALVSQYFSYGKKDGSHRLPKKGAEHLLQKMAETDALTIDEYVVGAMPGLREKLSTYRDVLNFDLGLVRRYEDVFFEKATFLTEVFAHFNIPVRQKVIQEVAEQFDVRPTTEDPSKHIRKGTPGDHTEKLHPDTIATLNDGFREVGAFYGYRL